MDGVDDAGTEAMNVASMSNRSDNGCAHSQFEEQSVEAASQPRVKRSRNPPCVLGDQASCSQPLSVRHTCIGCWHAHGHLPKDMTISQNLHRLAWMYTGLCAHAEVHRLVTLFPSLIEFVRHSCILAGSLHVRDSFTVLLP